MFCNSSRHYQNLHGPFSQLPWGGEETNCVMKKVGIISPYSRGATVKPIRYSESFMNSANNICRQSFLWYIH